MKHKAILKAILILVLISGSFIVLWPASNSRTADKPCTENMEECSKKNNGNSGEMILESLSRQFFSSTEISN